MGNFLGRIFVTEIVNDKEKNGSDKLKFGIGETCHGGIGD